MEKALPAGSSVADVKAFARAQQLECSDPTDGVVYCSAPAKSNMPLTAGKWLIRIHVPAGRVERIDVELGLTGP